MSYVDYGAVWSRRLEMAGQSGGQGPHALVSREMQKDALLKALPHYLLFCFCELKRHACATEWEPLAGLKPAQLHVIQKHHWLPDQAFSLTHDQLQLVLHDELRELALPEQAYQPVQADLDRLDIQGIQLKRQPLTTI
ncbi:MAG TPA: hypothetical protein VGC62_03875 [Pseudomonas sp.]|uniref:hypothetical protein n=1 Tax=Pseudomonas sp. TaxID=306 RepID=UPI002EDBB515